MDPLPFLQHASALRSWYGMPATQRSIERLNRANDALLERWDAHLERANTVLVRIAVLDVMDAASTAGLDPYQGTEDLLEFADRCGEHVEDTASLFSQALGLEGAAARTEAQRQIFEATFSARSRSNPWIVERFRALAPEFAAALIHETPDEVPDDLNVDSLIADRKAIDDENLNVSRWSQGVESLKERLRRALVRLGHGSAHHDGLPDIQAWLLLSSLRLNDDLHDDPISPLLELEAVIAKCPALMDAFLRVCLRADLYAGQESGPTCGTWKLAAWLREPARPGKVPGPLSDLFRKVGNTARKGFFNKRRAEVLKAVETDTDDDRALRHLARFLCEVLERAPDDIVGSLYQQWIRSLIVRLWELPEHIVAWHKAEATPPAPPPAPELANPEPLEPQAQEEATVTEETLVQLEQALDSLTPPVAPELADEASEQTTLDREGSPLRLIYVPNRAASAVGLKVHACTDQSLERTLEAIEEEHQLDLTISLSSIARAIRWHALELPAEHRHVWPKEHTGGRAWDKIKRGRMRIFLSRSDEGILLSLEQRRDWVHPTTAN